MVRSNRRVASPFDSAETGVLATGQIADHYQLQDEAVLAGSSVAISTYRLGEATAVGSASVAAPTLSQPVDMPITTETVPAISHAVITPALAVATAESGGVGEPVFAVQTLPHTLDTPIAEATPALPDAIASVSVDPVTTADTPPAPRR